MGATTDITNTEPVSDATGDFSVEGKIVKAIITSNQGVIGIGTTPTISGNQIVPIYSGTRYCNLLTGGIAGSSSYAHSLINETNITINPEFYCKLKTGSSIGNVRIWAGLMAGLSLSNTDDLNINVVAFRFSQGVDAGWVPVKDLGFPVPVLGSAIGVVAADTEYTLKIRVDSALNIAYFSVNGGVEQAISVSDVLTTTNYIFVVQIFTNENAPKNLLFSRSSLSIS